MDRDGSALSDAVATGDIENLERLLSSKDKVHLEDVNEDNLTALQLATAKGKLEMAELLLEHGADAMAKNEDGDTCLHLAAETGCEDLVRLFLKHIDVNCVNELLRTPLHVAVIKNKYDVARLLLDEGADPNLTPHHGSHVHECEHVTLTPLHYAVKYNRRRGWRTMIELLLARGADPNATSSIIYETVFERSFNILDEDLLNLFLDKGAMLSSDYNEDMNPLQTVILGDRHCEETKLNVIRTMVKSDASCLFTSEDNGTPLCFAAAKNYTRIVEYLLSVGDAVNGNSTDMPLFVAARRGHLEVIKLLIDHDVDLDVTNDDETDVLHVAVRNIQDKELCHSVVKLVLKEDFFNGSSRFLRRACRSGSTDVVKALVEVSAEMNLVDEDGDTLLANAVQYESDEIVKLLLYNGANANDIAAVSNAAASVKINTMKLLIANGAVLLLDDNHPLESRTIMISIIHQNSSMIQYLLDVEFNLNHDRAVEMLHLEEASNEYDQWFENEDMNECFRVIIQHIALLSSLNHSVPETVTAAMQRIEIATEYFKKCTTELEIMKKENVSCESSLSYYDFLVKCNNALVRGLRNPEVNDKLKSGVYKDSFEHYSAKIEVHHSNGMIRLRMMDEFRCILESIFEKVLPFVVIREISEYFNFTDFVKLFDKSVIYNIVEKS